jgi:hypothetical protein
MLSKHTDQPGLRAPVPNSLSTGLTRLSGAEHGFKQEQEINRPHFHLVMERAQV